MASPLDALNQGFQAILKRQNAPPPEPAAVLAVPQLAAPNLQQATGGSVLADLLSRPLVPDPEQTSNQQSRQSGQGGGGQSQGPAVPNVGPTPEVAQQANQLLGLLLRNAPAQANPNQINLLSLLGGQQQDQQAPFTLADLLSLRVFGGI